MVERYSEALARRYPKDEMLDEMDKVLPLVFRWRALHPCFVG
jgi:hypothetical protein